MMHDAGDEQNEGEGRGGGSMVMMKVVATAVAAAVAVGVVGTSVRRHVGTSARRYGMVKLFYGTFSLLKMPPCTAAPYATASSGLISRLGSFPLK